MRVVASVAGGGNVFAFGVIDFRMVSTIISRTENVDEDVMPQLDEAIARHAEKWMKPPANGVPPVGPEVARSRGPVIIPAICAGSGFCLPSRCASWPRPRPSSR